MPYGLKLPFSYSDDYTDWELVRDIYTEIKQNMKLLFMTSPGEKLDDPLYGIGIQRFLFETNGDSDRQEIISMIRNQIDQYLSFVRVDNIQFGNDPDVNSRYLMVVYSVPSLGIAVEKLMFQTEAELSVG